MQLYLFTVVATVVLILSVALDLGGTVGVMLMLLILVVAGALRVSQPLIDWIRS